MGRSQESFNKKEVRNKKEKKRKDKEKKRQARKENNKSNSLDDMIAYVDEHGNITDTPPDPDQKEEINVEDIQVSVPRGPFEEVDPIRKGTVTYFNSSKGFGFITDQETRESVFVHINNTLEEIREGNLVSFEVEKGQKGPVAVKVQVVR
jgi:cold shock CspA family protein